MALQASEAQLCPLQHPYSRNKPTYRVLLRSGFSESTVDLHVRAIAVLNRQIIREQ